MASTMRLQGGVPFIGHDQAASVFARDPGRLGAFRVQFDNTQSLSALIESEIIPRLMVAHATVMSATDMPGAKSPDVAAEIDFAEVEALAPRTRCSRISRASWPAGSPSMP